jgi:2-polyprenyl-6-methoxyphenol hydroxylase-like FAD-dependent oxidoreductase
MDVIVVGAGPTGLLLAAELALGGVRVEVIDRLTGPDLTVKGASIRITTAEMLDRRGLAPLSGHGRPRSRHISHSEAIFMSNAPVSDIDLFSDEARLCHGSSASRSWTHLRYSVTSSRAGAASVSASHENRCEASDGTRFRGCGDRHE